METTSIENLGFLKLKEIMPQILEGTNIQFKREAKATATYAGTRYFKLFIEEKENNSKYTPEIGIYMETKYANETLTLKAAISNISSYTINYINGGSKTFGKFENIDEYEINIPIDDEKLIDIGDIDNGKYDISDYFYDVNTKSFLKDYPNYITDTKGWYALPLDYVEELLNPIFDETLKFFKDNIPQIITNLSIDNVLYHLGEFKTLSDKYDLEKLSQIYKKCYCCCNDGTPTFDKQTSTQKYISKMSVPYGTLMGFRKYIEWNGKLYLWFGEDTVCSLWC